MKIKKTANHSLITEHKLKFGHEFDWDNPKIVDKEKQYYRRLISEMINIKSQKNVINLQAKTELLPQSYVEILNDVK